MVKNTRVKNHLPFDNYHHHQTGTL